MSSTAASSEQTSQGHAADVYVNIYDLNETAATFNTLRGKLVNKICRSSKQNRRLIAGAFHAGIEVYGVEYSYGATEEVETGVAISDPRHHEQHIYKQSEFLGRTVRSEEEIKRFLEDNKEKWMGNEYNILKKNCIDFAVFFADFLGVKPIPECVRALPTTANKLARDIDNLGRRFGFENAFDSLEQLIGGAFKSQYQMWEPGNYKSAAELIARLRRDGITDERVLNAMTKIPREKFFPEGSKWRTWHDAPSPIGFGQTISQPFIVACMTQLLRLEGAERVLEIGTGSGYQTAVLAELAKEVYTVERLAPLQKKAKDLLENELLYSNLRFKISDGWEGWHEESPFDAILVSAAPHSVPPALIEQIKPGGCMVVPIGTHSQWLTRITKKLDGSTTEERIEPVMFVPMVRGNEDFALL